MLQLFLLLFVGDVVFFADTVIGLKKQITILEKFCNDWNMCVNMKKTKVVVFKKVFRLASSENNCFKGKNIDVSVVQIPRNYVLKFVIMVKSYQ
jgi:hypothetical protein